MLLFARNSRLKAILKIVKKINTTNSKSGKNRQKNLILHAKISKYLFDAVDNNDYAIIKLILFDNYVRADLVYDKNHLDIVRSSIYNNNDSLFEFLSMRAYQHITCYFNNIPELFTLASNRKSLGIMKMILKDERFLNRLSRVNIPPCLYFAVQNNDSRIFELIVDNNYLLSLVDGRDIQSYLIYMISHNQYGEMKIFLSNPRLINKCDESNINNIFALALLNRDDRAIEKLLESRYILNIIEESDENLLRNLLMLATTTNNLGLMMLLSKNGVIMNKVSKKEENNNIIDFEKIRKVSG